MNTVLKLNLDSVHFITDSKGIKQAAVLPIALYHELLALKSILPESCHLKPAKFHFEVKGITAYGYPKGHANKPLFIVSKNSWIIGDKASSLRPGVQKLRDELIQRGVLQKVGDNYQFQSDYQFNSPSMAACMVAGNARSGMDAWVNEQGDSLKACGYGKS